MSHWNYRLGKKLHKYTIGTVQREHYVYAVYEVYYNEDGSIFASSEEPQSIMATLEPWDCDTEEECIASLADQLTKMQLALAKPVLDIDNIEYKGDSNGL
jgi:hypothetical protein